MGINSKKNGVTKDSKAPLKWLGGKFRLLDRIFEMIPKDFERRRFVDVFAGSAVVGANAQGFKRLWINDINSDLVSFYNCVKENPGRLLNLAEKLFTHKNRSEARYYQIRAKFNSKAGSKYYRSALFFYLNKHTYNGLCRYNRKGEFNAPFGWPRASLKVDRASMLAFAKLVKRAAVTGESFQNVISRCGEGDIVFCDPPYSSLSKKKAKNFTAYAPGEFGPDEHSELVEAAKQAAARGAVVIICNHATIETRQLYRSALVVEFLVRRSIGANGSSRIKAPELLAVYRAGLRRKRPTVGKS